MKVVFTEQSLDSLQEALFFLLEEQGLSKPQVSKIKWQLLEKAESLVFHPSIGQKEEHLEHLEKDHRRLIEGNFKIIYRVEGDLIYITDFFDIRQEPAKMKG